MKRALFAVAALFTVCASQSANALTYTETVDLPNGSSFGAGSVSIGTLLGGTNSIIGSLSGTCTLVNDCNPSGAIDAQDSFLFTIPVGVELTQLRLVGSNYMGPPNFFASIQIRSPSATVTFIPFVDLSTPFSMNVNLGPGTYSYSVYGQRAGGEGAYSFNYNAGLVASGPGAVPEPATWAMMITGFGAAGAVLRRRRMAIAA